MKGPAFDACSYLHGSLGDTRAGVLVSALCPNKSDLSHLVPFPSANVTCRPTAHYIVRTHYCKVCISERIVLQLLGWLINYRVIPVYPLATWECRSCFSVSAGVERAGKAALTEGKVRNLPSMEARVSMCTSLWSSHVSVLRRTFSLSLRT